MPRLKVKDMPRRQQKAVKAAMAESMAKMKKSPTLKKLSEGCKAAARAKFDVYPSAYANMWASGQQTKGKC